MHDSIRFPLKQHAIFEAFVPTCPPAIRVLCSAVVLISSLARAVELKPATAAFKLPDQIDAARHPLSARRLRCWPAIRLSPDFYIVMVKWPAGNHSAPRPINHGAQGNLVGWYRHQVRHHVSVAMPAGSFVTHYREQVHFDGAKDEDPVLLIVGEGPATATPVEVKWGDRGSGRRPRCRLRDDGTTA